eukprot:UN25130
MVNYGEICRLLRTTDVLFGTVYVNIAIICINLLQIFGSIVSVCLILKNDFDSGLIWWIMLDGIRVLGATVVRLESLLKENNHQRSLIRNALLLSNILGIFMSVISAVYFFTIIGRRQFVAFEIMSSALVLLHLFTSVPALFEIHHKISNSNSSISNVDPLLQYQQIDNSNEPAVNLQSNPRINSNANRSVVHFSRGSEAAENNGVLQDFNPNPVPNAFAIDVANQELIWRLAQQHNEHQQEIVRERSLRESQDLEYNNMVFEHEVMSPSNSKNNKNKTDNENNALQEQYASSEPTMAEIPASGGADSQIEQPEIKLQNMKNRTKVRILFITYTFA